MVGFLGQSEHSIDDKGRVALPASMRRELSPEANETFNAYRSDDHCVILIPADVWAVRVRQLNGLNSYKSDNRRVKRGESGRSKLVSLDGQGRITLPRSHIDHAGLHAGAVVVLGTIDTIEIWDPEILRVEEEEIADSYSDLVERVMNKLDNE